MSSVSVDSIAEQRKTPWPALASVLCGLTAAWAAASSLGLYGAPLTRAIIWVLLGAAWLLGARGSTTRDERADISPWRIATSLLAFALGALLLSSTDPGARVAAVAAIWAALPARDARLHRDTTRALLVFAVYVFAVRAVPAVWYLAKLGNITSFGMTFFGSDILVLALAFHLLRLRGLPDLRRRVALTFALCLGVHALYLVAFWTFAGIGTAAGEAIASGELEGAALAKEEFWRELLTSQVWNMPSLAATLQLVLCAALLRRARRGEGGGEAETIAPAQGLAPRFGLASACALVALAAFVPAWLSLPFGKSTLEGKRIVTFEKVYGNWDVPKHGDYGRLSIGMYGMLETFVTSLGATFVRSPDLSEADLEDADVLVLIYPNKDWEPGQLERIDRYVRDGGALLVMGEHTTVEESGGARYNDVLEPTGMQIAFDTAEAYVGGWLQSYDRMQHPSSVDLDGDHNDYGIVAGASVDIAWPARPLLFGRWGWNDPGELSKKDSSYMGNRKYDLGERIGDLVLAAEQDYGDGVIMAFGDPSTMTNGITMGAHEYSSRLLAWLASRPSAPSSWWRQLSGLAAIVVLLALIARGAGFPLVLAGLAFSYSLSTSGELCRAWTKVLPDGRQQGKPNMLAYFDCAHFGRWSDESWREHGTMGLRMTLNRNGYQCLELRDFDEARLERAGLLVSLAPRREFDAEERQLLRRWVADGGLFFVSASYPDRRASTELLADFGFEIGRVEGSLDREPQPMGHMKSPYHQWPDGAQVFVRFHEGWPVADIAANVPPTDLASVQAMLPEHSRRMNQWLLNAALSETMPATPKLPPARVLAYGTGNRPTMMMRRCGLGAFVVVADSLFGINRNLERVDGSKFEQLRENADFWRWLLCHMRGDPQPWYPPHPKSREAKEAK